MEGGNPLFFLRRKPENLPSSLSPETVNPESEGVVPEVEGEWTGTGTGRQFKTPVLRETPEEPV